MPDVTITTGSYVLVNPGSVYSEPIITVNGSGDITLIINEEFVELTGIDDSMVSGAPKVREAVTEFLRFAAGKILVAHNASFDIGVLRKCLAAYEIAWKPYVKGICTVTMGRSLLPGVSHKLNDLCDYYSICLNHHQADSDSRAAAEILLRYLRSGAVPEKFIRSYRMM